MLTAITNRVFAVSTQKDHTHFMTDTATLTARLQRLRIELPDLEDAQALVDCLRLLIVSTLSI